MTPGPCSVFVYGTLMPGERNAHVATRGGAVLAQGAGLRGYALYHLSPEAYPALVPGPPGATVRGQLLTYTPAAWRVALPFLDDLEGLHETPPLYTRSLVTLQLDSGGEAPGWVYVYARAERLGQPGAQPVPSGDWRAVPGRDRPAPGER
ncbi:gamma-glutamylcyclotransferase family protein [Deinococcus arcticus]|uniref:Gamma-glutamylcyclotransferase AIG2-like domain-containing protein n=1 Tax=Deinococcus arcticus TaxID=2136176 RepID=A0A2T3WA98_9DEIO|nr:gamma-glutamylcyclotransferase family protein [Deinococcus arcticus]PTA68752.1 hypothetical protein C8263_05795 [Deinococcus arcticus]